MTSPYTVTIPEVSLFVGDRIPSSMATALGNATLYSMIRIMGGMNNPPEIFSFFERALAGLDGGFLWSGATRCLDENGKIQPSVAEIVAHMGARLPNLITAGSCPRTERFKIRGEGTLMLGVDTFVNPATTFVSVIQKGPEDGDALGWDGDVEAYLSWMAHAREEMGFSLGGIVWNGGGVTVAEATLAHTSYNIPIFVIAGSGRQADDKLSAKSFSGPHIHHVSKDEPERLRDLLKTYNLSR